jgi:hypothetical protein
MDRVIKILKYCRMDDEPLIVLAGVVALFVVIFCYQCYTRAPPPRPKKNPMEVTTMEAIL